MKNEATIKRILGGIASGLNNRQACKAAGLTDRTFINWRKDDPELEERLEAAREVMRAKVLAKIKAAGDNGDWRAHECFLRLAFAEYRYGTPSVSVNTNVVNAQIAQVTDERRQQLIDLRNEALSDKLELTDQNSTEWVASREVVK
jgi:hypothetical protein